MSMSIRLADLGMVLRHLALFESLLVIVISNGVSRAQDSGEGGGHVPRGFGLVIGVGEVDPNHYAGKNGALKAPERDASDMKILLSGQGFEVKSLITKSATREAVLGSLESYAKDLKSGDTLVVYFSGHGAQIPDSKVNRDEFDSLDEAWCLYNGMVIDDELYDSYAKFAEGTRLVVVSDSCNSGTIWGNWETENRTEVAMKLLNATQPGEELKPSEAFSRINPEPSPIKRLSSQDGFKVYELHEEFYTKLQESVPSESKSRKSLLCSLILLAAADDGESASDAIRNERNSLYTQMIKVVWDDGRFEGGYKMFNDFIYRRMRDQKCSVTPEGQPNVDFLIQKPFTFKE